MPATLSQRQLSATNNLLYKSVPGNRIKRKEVERLVEQELEPRYAS